MGSKAPERPIVAVIGTTGVGKSQLAVSLAQSLARRQALQSGANASAEAGPSIQTPARGVVLSADSMQLYKGLDVITNKVTKEEMGGIEHWGLDVVSPGQGGSWEVGRWCLEASQKVCPTSKEEDEGRELILGQRSWTGYAAYHLWWNALLCATLLIPAFGPVTFETWLAELGTNIHA